ncbi:hypothetical protein EMCRGX_G016251, partial [Ephydatia muelleri]
EDSELHEMKVVLVFIAVLVVVAATSDGYNQHKGESRTKTRSKTDGKHQPVYNHHKGESRTRTRSKTDGKHQPVYNHHKGESRTRTRSKTDGKHQPVYNHHKGETRTRTRPTTDGKYRPVYCPKPNPPVYGYIKENNAYYQIGSIIHYYCNYGYELYGSSWNKCVYEYGVAKWEYPVPICKPKAYSG